MRTRETSNENASFVKDPFSPYNVDNVDGHRVPRTAGQVSFENSSKNTTKAQNASINVINSDPIDFFNQQPLKLTKKNLDMVAPTPSEADRGFGIESVNPRSEFLQFTTDEDKESTVIESVRFPGEDQYGTESKDEDEDLLDDDDPYGIAYIDKGTVVPAVGVKTPSNRTNETMTKLNEAVFPAFTFIDGNQLKTDPFFSEAGPFEPKESDRDSGILSAQQFQSTHSLAYSASSCGETNNLQKSENLHRFMNKLEDHRGQNRFPLSPRNVFSNSKLPERGMSKINTKADPDVKWADFSDCAFEKKPDRKGGSEASNFITSHQASITVHGFPENNENARPKHRHPRNIESQGQQTSKPSNQVWGQRVIPEDEPVDPDEDDGAEGSEILHNAYGFTAIRRDSEEIGRPIGIQRFPTVALGSSRRSHGSSSTIRSTPQSNRYNETDSYNSHSHHQSTNGSTTTEAAIVKPLGIPNNAIMASMLFRRHHDIDAEVVEAKLREHEQAYKTDRNRGDIPRSVQALDGFSNVSSFSDDTGVKLDMWLRPTQDLLNHFSRSRRANTDFTSRLREQRVQATELFEA
jgi:hypothetical protein